VGEGHLEEPPADDGDGSQPQDEAKGEESDASSQVVDAGGLPGKALLEEPACQCAFRTQKFL